jgi:8-oxo-dGTP diphosphatase
MTAVSEINVALAVIAAGHDAQGRPQYWLERRPSATDFAGLLAFPGGKVMAGETPLQALARELAEELGIRLQAATLLIEVPWVYPAVPPAESKHLRLWLYRVDAWVPVAAGAIQGREGQTVLPVVIDRVQARVVADQLPAANRGMVAALCLPPRIAISGACSAGASGFDRWLADLQHMARALAIQTSAAAIIQLRPQRALSLAEWQAAIAVVQAEQLPAWVNADFAMALACAADGVHLNRQRLFSVTRDEVGAWQSQNRWVSASGHDANEIDRANQLGVDAVLISPVLPTPSHPEAAGIGWAAFSALVRQASMPAFALGGMSEAHITIAKAQGGQGIAAISGYWQAENTAD